MDHWCIVTDRIVWRLVGYCVSIDRSISDGSTSGVPSGVACAACRRVPAAAAAAAGVAAVLDVDVVVSRAPEHAGGSSRRRRRPAEDAPVRVAGARLLPLRHRRQIELRVSVRGSSVRYVQ